MKALDDFIWKNSGLFNEEEPADGHFDRFETRLNRSVAQRKYQKRMFIFKIAASVILFIGLSYLGIRKLNLSDIWNKDYDVTMVELNEAEQYYNAQFDIYYQKINALPFNNDKVEKENIFNELAEMDDQVQLMKKDLLQNPDDERIVYAIINYYQVKIEIMDLIISHAQESNKLIL